MLLICNPGSIECTADERLVRGDPYFIVMDSLGGDHTIALSVIRSYLRHEYLERKGSPLSLPKERMGELEADMPRQENGCDCGIYLLHYIELIFKARSLLQFGFRIIFTINNQKQTIFSWYFDAGSWQVLLA